MENVAIGFKYGLGQDVFFFDSHGAPRRGTVSQRNYSEANLAFGIDTAIEYRVQAYIQMNCAIREEDLYSSREEILKKVSSKL